MLAKRALENILKYKINFSMADDDEYEDQEEEMADQTTREQRTLTDAVQAIYGPLLDIEDRARMPHNNNILNLNISLRQLCI